MRVARRTFLASAMAAVAAPAVLRVAAADPSRMTLKLHHDFSSVSCVHDRFLALLAQGGDALDRMFPPIKSHFSVVYDCGSMG